MFLGLHTVLQVFVFSRREKEEGGGHVRQRLLAQETESSDTVLESDSSAVFMTIMESFKPKVVEWGHEFARQADVFSP